MYLPAIDSYVGFCTTMKSLLYQMAAFSLKKIIYEIKTSFFL
jgi:hypothetical protein